MRVKFRSYSDEVEWASVGERVGGGSPRMSAIAHCLPFQKFETDRILVPPVSGICFFVKTDGCHVRFFLNTILFSKILPQSE